MKKERGITLISLVITIIILLILAGVTLNLTIGENGIFRLAQQASKNYMEAGKKEEDMLEELENAMGYYLLGTRTEKKVQDYTDNLIYRLNLDNLNNQEGVTITGIGAQVSENKKILSLDGATYILVDNRTVDPEAKYAGKTEVTFSCWYKTQDACTNNPTLIQYGTKDSADFELIMALLPNNQIRYNSTGNPFNRIIDPYNRSDGQWHHIVFVRDSVNSLIGYYDGVPFRGTGTYKSNIQKDTYLTIGSEDGIHFFKGYVSDVRIYDGALREKEVKQIYEWGKQYLGIY